MRSKIRIEMLILKNTLLNGLKTPFFSDKTRRLDDEL